MTSLHEAGYVVYARRPGARWQADGPAVGRAQAAARADVLARELAAVPPAYELDDPGRVAYLPAGWTPGAVALAWARQVWSIYRTDYVRFASEAVSRFGLELDELTDLVVAYMGHVRPGTLSGGAARLMRRAESYALDGDKLAFDAGRTKTVNLGDLTREIGGAGRPGTLPERPPERRKGRRTRAARTPRRAAGGGQATHQRRGGGDDADGAKAARVQHVLGVIVQERQKQLDAITTCCGQEARQQFMCYMERAAVAIVEQDEATAAAVNAEAKQFWNDQRRRCEAARANGRSAGAHRPRDEDGDRVFLDSLTAAARGRPDDPDLHGPDCFCDDCVGRRRAAAPREPRPAAGRVPMLAPCSHTRYMAHTEKPLLRRLGWVACGRWLCPTCLRRLRGEWSCHLAATVGAQPGPVYVATVSHACWGGVQRGIQRSGSHAEYARVLRPGDQFLVAATVAMPGATALPPAEAARLVADAVAKAEPANGVRPVSTSRGWALRREKTHKWQVVGTLPADLDVPTSYRVLNSHGIEPKMVTPKRGLMRLALDFEIPGWWTEEQSDALYLRLHEGIEAPPPDGRPDGHKAHAPPGDLDLADP